MPLGIEKKEAANVVTMAESRQALNSKTQSLNPLLQTLRRFLPDEFPESHCSIKGALFWGGVSAGFMSPLFKTLFTFSLFHPYIGNWAAIPAIASHLTSGALSMKINGEFYPTLADTSQWNFGYAFLRFLYASAVVWCAIFLSLVNSQSFFGLGAGIILACITYFGTMPSHDFAVFTLLKNIWHQEREILLSVKWGRQAREGNVPILDGQGKAQKMAGTRQAIVFAREYPSYLPVRQIAIFLSFALSFTATSVYFPTGNQLLNYVHGNDIKDVHYTVGGVLLSLFPFFGNAILGSCGIHKIFTGALNYLYSDDRSKELSNLQIASCALLSAISAIAFSAFALEEVGPFEWKLALAVIGGFTQALFDFYKLIMRARTEVEKAPIIEVPMTSPSAA